MSEELLQRNLLEKPDKIGKYSYYNIGSTTIKQLKESGIIVNKAYKGIERRKPDGLIVFNKKVIAIIENKDPKEFNSQKKKSKANNQSWQIAKVLKPKIIISTDTTNSTWLNGLRNEPILDEKNNEILIPFNLNNFDEIEKTIDKVVNSISDENSKIIPLEYTNPIPLAKAVWQETYMASHATPENCLYTFIELFIFKYLSDLNILTGRRSFKYVYDLYSEDTLEGVLDYYAQNIRTHIKKLFPASSKDFTTIINGTIFVNSKDEPVKGYSTAFKSILEKFNSFGELKNIDLDFKSKIFEVFFKDDNSKGGMGQYFTPLKVVQQMVNMAEIKEGMVISDPACGVGKFILEAIVKNIEDYYEFKNGKIIKKITIEGLDKGFTKDTERTIILAKANMLIYFSELIKEHPDFTEEFSDLFNETFTLKTKSILGTLEDAVNEKYDLILTNPPYVMSGSKILKDEISRSPLLTSHYTANGQGVEGLFVEWIIKALKKSGKAFVVIPDGILSRNNDNNLRRFILKECYIDSIISLPRKTFFTTPKKTFIFAITRKNDISIKQRKPVYTYLVSDIGETLDTNRFDTEDNQLERAVQDFHVFNSYADRGRKFVSNDDRCKIIDIEYFYKNIDESWIIDDLWTKEEKVNLGILKQDNIYSVNEYGNIIKGIAEELFVYEAQIKELSNDKD